MGERANYTMTQLAEAKTAQCCDGAPRSLVSEPATMPRRLTQAEQRELIRAALARDPTLPDLRIARVIGCAANTVARVREAAGVAPYRRHRDRRPLNDTQASKRLLRAKIDALTEELARERSLRIKAEQAVATVRAAVPQAPPIVYRPPTGAAELVVPLGRDPLMRRAAQVPTQGRGLPAAVHCEECGDTRFWTDRDAQVWYCAGCYPPEHGRLMHKTGRWP
jgi:hypothetical protein